MSLFKKPFRVSGATYTIAVNAISKLTPTEFQAICDVAKDRTMWPGLVAAYRNMLP